MVLSESSLEDIPFFLKGNYPERYRCPGCAKYYLAEDCIQPVGRALCPVCSRPVRTRLRNKGRSKHEHKYAESINKFK